MRQSKEHTQWTGVPAPRLRFESRPETWSEPGCRLAAGWLSGDAPQKLAKIPNQHAGRLCQPRTARFGGPSPTPCTAVLQAFDLGLKVPVPRALPGNNADC